MVLEILKKQYKAGALSSMTSEKEMYRMNLARVQEVRWKGSGTLESENYTLFYAKINVSKNW